MHTSNLANESVTKSEAATDLTPVAAAERAQEAAHRSQLAAQAVLAAQRTAEHAARDASEAADAAARATLTVWTDEASQLIADLEHAYHAVLDQLQDQVSGAAMINDSLRKVLDTGSDLPLINFHPDRAITPQQAFKELGEILVRKERPRLDPRSTRREIRYDDLLRWTDEPPRGNLSVSEFASAKIAHARTKSLQDFYQRLLVRLTPEAVPAKAAEYVFEELSAALSVMVPPCIIVPYSTNNSGTIVFMRLTRAQQQKPWYLTAEQFASLEQALLALATACVLAGHEKTASVITEAGNELVMRLHESHRQYVHADEQRGGNQIRVLLLRDKIEFHLSNQVMDVLRNIMLNNSKGIEFVRI